MKIDAINILNDNLSKNDSMNQIMDLINEGGGNDNKISRKRLSELVKESESFIQFCLKVNLIQVSGKNDKDEANLNQNKIQDSFFEI